MENTSIEKQNTSIADKFSGESCKLYILSGERNAIVAGRLNKFATISSLDGETSIQVNWKLVERKMNGDKTFYAC